MRTAWVCGSSRRHDGDLIVTERNPLADIAILEDVLLVVNNGRVSVTRGDWFERQRLIPE